MATPNDRRDRLWVLALTSVANLTVALDAMVVSTALTAIGRDLGASIEALQWTVNAYALSFAAFILTAAVLGDRFGRRRVFAIGLLLFVAASAACALASGIGWLIAARAVQGVGAAMVVPLALSQISAAFPPDRRGRALGIFSTSAGLSTILGPVVGGVVTTGLAWQWIFWLNVPIGLAAAALVVARMRETFGAKGTIDLPGLVLATGGAFSFVWGLVRAGDAGWASVEIVSSLAAGALMIALFVAWELRAPQPMIPMRFFRSRAFAAGNAAMFFLNAALMSAIFFMAQFQQVALGADPLIAGLRLLPWGFAAIIGARSAAPVAKGFGTAWATALALAIQAAGLAWIALIADPGVSYLQMILPMILAGVGFGVAVVIAQTAVVGAVAVTDIGKAVGTLSTVRQVGSVFGVALTVAVFARAGSHGSALAFSRGFASAMGVAAMLSLAGAGAGLLLTGRSRAGVALPAGPPLLSGVDDKA